MFTEFNISTAIVILPMVLVYQVYASSEPTYIPSSLVPSGWLVEHERAWIRTDLITNLGDFELEFSHY